MVTTSDRFKCSELTAFVASKEVVKLLLTRPGQLRVWLPFRFRPTELCNKRQQAAVL